MMMAMMKMMIKYKSINRLAPFYFARIKETNGIFEKVDG